MCEKCEIANEEGESPNGKKSVRKCVCVWGGGGGEGQKSLKKV